MRRILLFCLLPFFLFSMRPGGKFKTLIVGKVLDSETGTPLEYATVIAYRLPDSTKAGGIATDSLGRFALRNLPFGEYYIEVDFLGYKKKVIKPVKLTPSKSFVRLGKIYLKPAYIEAKPVEVKARAPQITFKIDRKVVQVGKELSSEAITAVDVLKNVPSIEVDIEGNVKLRGSSSFTLLIDGRPTLADPSEVLQQMPAAMIDKIEIITNPSAKYDPEGEAGIINVVLKKGKKRRSGYTISVSAGRYDNYGANLLYTKRTDKLDIFLSLNASKRNFPGEITVFKEYFSDSDTVVISSTGNSEFSRNPISFRGGLNFKVSRSGMLSIGGNYFKWGMSRINENDYADTKTVETFDLQHPIWGVFAGYTHRFSPMHKLSADMSYGRGSRDIETHYLEKLFDGTPVYGRKVSGGGPSYRVDFKINYERPFSEKWKFEIGSQSKFRYREDLSEYYRYDTTVSTFVRDTTYDINYSQKREIHSVYSLLSGSVRAIGFQAGLRGEIEKREIKDLRTGETFSMETSDLFPSLHISMGDITQVMFSYTRRIRRPRGWMIAPFRVWVDPHTIRKGNPDLKPVYIDSYEASFKYPVLRGFISASIYHKTIHDDIERITIPLSQDVFIETFGNAGTGYRTGVEAFINMDLFSNFSVNWSFDMYRYYIKGTLADRTYENRSVSWSVRMINELDLRGDVRLQVVFRYRSPVATLQGERAGFHTVDLGLRKKIGRNLSLSLRLQNIDGGFKWEYFSEGPDYYARKSFSRDPLMVSLSVQYSYNMYKKQRERFEEPNNFEEAF